MSHTSLRNQKLNKLPYLPTTKFNDLHTSVPLSLQSFRYYNGWNVPDKSQKLTRTWLQRAAQISISSPDCPTPLTFYLISQPRCLTDTPQIQTFPSTSTLCSISLLNSRTLTGQLASILIPRQQGVVFKKHQSAYSSAYCPVASPPSSGLEPNTLPWPTEPEGTGPLQGSVLISSPPPLTHFL